MKYVKNDKAQLEKVTKGEPVSEQTTASEKAAETGRRGRQTSARWTVIDTVIVLMVLLAIAGAVLRSVMDSDKDKVVADTGTYYVDFTIPEIHPSVLAEIQAFDALYTYETNTHVGYVGAYDDGTIALRTVTPLNSNGSFVAAEGCMVCLEGTMKDGSLLIRGMDTYLTPGMSLTLCTERVMIVIEISDIQAAEP